MTIDLEQRSSSRFNTMSVVGFILAFIVNIAGLIVSIVALVQIRRTAERGRGLAIAGIIISGLSIAIVLIAIVAAAIAATQMGN